jgi:CheY-like chemotaxis protein
MSLYKNILLIEDDHDDQDLFLEVMRGIDDSIACTVAEDGIDALEVFEEMPARPDLIFLDLNMPKMSGNEFMSAVHNNERYKGFANIPIIILTTNDSERDVCFKLGACLCLAKPVTMTTYRTMLITVLASDVLKHREDLRYLFSGER